MNKPLTASQIVINKFPGGVGEVAEITGLTINAIYRWNYPKSKAGSDGRVPSKYQDMLLKAARDRGYDLRPEHFFADLYGEVQ